MSVQKFKQLVAASKLKKNDKTWFPRWVQRYSISVSNRHGLLRVTVDTVMQFSRSLRDNSTPAWQRLQVVRADDACRDLVLQQSKPAVNEIRVKLSRQTAKERDITSRPDATDQRKVIGMIDLSEQQVYGVQEKNACSLRTRVTLVPVNPPRWTSSQIRRTACTTSFPRRDSG